MCGGWNPLARFGWPAACAACVLPTAGRCWRGCSGCGCRPRSRPATRGSASRPSACARCWTNLQSAWGRSSCQPALSCVTHLPLSGCRPALRWRGRVRHRLGPPVPLALHPGRGDRRLAPTQQLRQQRWGQRALLAAPRGASPAATRLGRWRPATGCWTGALCSSAARRWPMRSSCSAAGRAAAAEPWATARLAAGAAPQGGLRQGGLRRSGPPRPLGWQLRGWHCRCFWPGMPALVAERLPGATHLVPAEEHSSWAWFQHALAAWVTTLGLNS